jgi:hypothetical protein
MTNVRHYIANAGEPQSINPLTRIVKKSIILAS